MTQHHPKILFVLADGAHARMVRRSAETGDFVTVREIDGGGHLRAAHVKAKSHPSGRSFQSASPSRSAVGADDPYRQVKMDFMGRIAEAAETLAAEDGSAGVVLIATRRLLPELRRDMGSGVRVLGQLAKDLIKVPDHALVEWLGPLEMFPQEA